MELITCLALEQAIQRLANIEELAAIVRSSPAGQLVRTDQAMYGSRDNSGSLNPEYAPDGREPGASAAAEQASILTPSTPPGPASSRATFAR